MNKQRFERPNAMNDTAPADLSRREFLASSVGAAALGMCGWPHAADAQSRSAWDQGQLIHLIPTASHDRFLANGDHIYYDIETALSRPRLKQYQEMVWPKFGGPLDISVPMLHPSNAAIFTNVCDYQICGLYGTTLRSTPAFFVTDDHDMFENDEFDERLATLPPDTYGTLAAEQTQHLYYPEFLPDHNRPEWLPAATRPRRMASPSSTRRPRN